MSKLVVRGLVAIAVVLGGIYIFMPSGNAKAAQTTSATNTTSNSKYVSLESNTNTNNIDNNIPKGFSIKASQAAKSSGVLPNFEEAIKDKYLGDGNVEIYIAQTTGSFGGVEQAIYDVNINGKEYMNLTATRTVTSQGFGSGMEMTPIVWGNSSTIESSN